MHILIVSLALLCSPLLAPQALAAQTIGEVTDALGRGDLAALKGMMDAEVDLSLPTEENLYSREQAASKLQAFFAANAPAGFSQVHQGSSKSDDAEYCIGNLATATGSYRVYVYVARKGDRMVLQELRFDRE
jgi:hypothetical protein